MIEVLLSEFEPEVVLDVVVALLELDRAEGQFIDELPHCLFRPPSELPHLLQQHQLLLRCGLLCHLF